MTMFDFADRYHEFFAALLVGILFFAGLYLCERTR